jgi:hypothetical protein
MAGERRLLLLCKTFLLRISGRRRSPGVEDRPAEISRQRRPKLRRCLWQAAIILWEIGESVRRVAIVGVVQFGACSVGLRLQREEQRAADAEGRSRPKAEQNFAGQTGDGRAVRPQSHLLRRTTPVFMGRIGHRCGLPSVRTMRTICWCLPPSRSSAAANKRSTIMWLPWTR